MIRRSRSFDSVMVDDCHPHASPEMALMILVRGKTRNNYSMSDFPISATRASNATSYWSNFISVSSPLILAKCHGGALNVSFCVHRYAAPNISQDASGSRPTWTCIYEQRYLTSYLSSIGHAERALPVCRAAFHLDRKSFSRCGTHRVVWPRTTLLMVF